MNRHDFRAAFDAASGTGDLEARTLRRLRAAMAQASEKEQKAMRINRIKKTALLAAAVAAVLAVTVSAAVLWLSPAQVADALQDPALAAAFRSGDAVTCNEVRSAGSCTVTLLGLVSGRELSSLGNDLEQDHTYVVTSLANADGTPLDAETFEPFAWTVTPLVAGYPVRSVNSWTLDGFAQCTVLDGIAYYILDVQNLQMFADRTVYLAVYEGGVPTAETFSMAEDGSISLREGVTGALFTLPLDPAQADPEAAQAFLDGLGMEVPAG